MTKPELLSREVENSKIKVWQWCIAVWSCLTVLYRAD